MPKAPKGTQTSQIEKFKQAAKQLETDDSAEAFKKALHRVATAKPKESKEKSSDRGR